MSNLLELEFELFEYQEGFVFDCDNSTIVMKGGMGSAKSTAFVHHCIFMSAVHAGKPGAAMSPTFPMTQGNLVPIFRELIDKYELDASGLESSEPKFIDMHWGSKTSRIWLNRTAENHGRLNGMNLAWAGLDEADKCRPQDVVLAVEQMAFRCRNPVNGYPAQVFLTGTPEGKAFLYDFCESGKVDAIYHARTDQNYMLPKHYIPNLLKQIPKHKHKAYLEGEFVSLTDGGVYKSYDFKENNITMTLGDYNSQTDQLWFSFDLNYGGMSCVFFIIRDKKIYFVKELMGLLDTDVLLTRVKKELDNWKIPHQNAILTCDPACTQALPIIKKHGFRTKIMQSHPPIEWSVTAMNGMFMDANNERKAFVNIKTCPIFSKCLSIQQYVNGEPDKKTKIPEAKTDVSGPVDAGRYGLFVNFPYRPGAQSAIQLRGF